MATADQPSSSMLEHHGQIVGRFARPTGDPRTLREVADSMPCQVTQSSPFWQPPSAQLFLFQTSDFHPNQIASRDLPAFGLNRYAREILETSSDWGDIDQTSTVCQAPSMIQHSWSCFQLRLDNAIDYHISAICPPVHPSSAAYLTINTDRIAPPTPCLLRC
jgi:hypothetical protein